MSNQHLCPHEHRLTSSPRSTATSKYKLTLSSSSEATVIRTSLICNYQYTLTNVQLRVLWGSIPKQGVLRRERCTQSEIADRGTKTICLWPYRRLLCLQKLHRLCEARKRTAYGLCRAVEQLGRVSRYLTLNDQVPEW